MAECGRHIYNIHAGIVIRFHGEREVISHHILLAQEIGCGDPLCLRIITGKQFVFFPKSLHRPNSLLFHVSLIDQKTFPIPLHLLRQRIQLLHDVISYLDQFPVRIGSLRLLCHICFVEFRSVVQNKAVPGHDHENRQEAPGIHLEKSGNEHLYSPFSYKNAHKAHYNGCGRKKNSQNNHPLSHGKGKDRHQPSVKVDRKRKQMLHMPVTERLAVPRDHIHRRRQKK